MPAFSFIYTNLLDVFWGRDGLRLPYDSS
jgi:hypothetical protein